MIELKEAIYWKLVNNKDEVVNTSRISGDKLSNYIGAGDTNRIFYSYPESQPEYPCMIISCRDDQEDEWPETSRSLVEIYFYTSRDKAGGKQHTQLNSFYKLVKHFLAEQWDSFTDLEDVTDGNDNLVIGGKFHVESFKLNWKGDVIYLSSSKEFQLPSRWISYLTETQEV